MGNGRLAVEGASLLSMLSGAGAVRTAVAQAGKTAVKGGINVAKTGASFADDAKLLDHFSKHAAEFGAKTADEYLQIGRDIMQNGQKVEYFYKPAGEMRTGYVQFMENSSKTGNAKFGFVGTNTDGAITTIHVESGKDFWKTINASPTDKVIRPVP
jgi:filamentous hemagglutinin